MPLTPEEQAELDSLNSRASIQSQEPVQQKAAQQNVPIQPKSPIQEESVRPDVAEEMPASLPVASVGQDEATPQVLAKELTVDEQAELDQLQVRADTTTQTQDEVSSLLDELKQAGGAPKTFEPEKRLSPFARDPKTVSKKIPFSRIGQLTKQQELFEQLTDKGLSPKQIDLTLKAKGVLEGPRVGRTAGGIGGAIATTAIAGRLIPGPFDDAAILAAFLASSGAGVGGVAGEAVQTGVEEGRLITGREALGAFANESLTELGGRGLVGAGKFVFSPLIKQLVPEAASLVDDFAKVGGNFSPSELDKRFSIRVGEAFSRGGFGAKEIFQEFEEKQGRAALAFASEIVDSISEGIARQTPEEIGSIFADGITRPGGRILNILDDLVTPLYKQVDELAEGVSVSTRSLKSFAKKELAKDVRLNKLFLSPTGRSKLTKIVELSDEVSFSDMRTLRSSFLKDISKMARDVDQSQGIIKQIAGITDQAIFDPKAAKGMSEEGLRLLRNTNRLYKAGQQGIKTTFSESIAKRLLKNPSSVIREVFPNNNPKAIRLLRESLVEPISGRPIAEGKILWNQLRQEWLADVVNKATQKGVTEPKVLDNLLRKMGDKGFREMFPEPNIAKEVKKISTLFGVAGQTPPSGASLFARGAQVGGLGLMYKGAKEGDFVGFTAGATLALGPLAFAKLATSPKGASLLTIGFNLKPGASGIVPNTVRMVRLLRSIDSKEQRIKKIAKTRKEMERFGRTIEGTTP